MAVALAVAVAVAAALAVVMTMVVAVAVAMVVAVAVAGLWSVLRLLAVVLTAVVSHSATQNLQKVRCFWV